MASGKQKTQTKTRSNKLNALLLPTIVAIAAVVVAHYTGQIHVPTALRRINSYFEFSEIEEVKVALSKERLSQEEDELQLQAEPRSSEKADTPATETEKSASNSGEAGDGGSETPGEAVRAEEDAAGATATNVTDSEDNAVFDNVYVPLKIHFLNKHEERM
jgi:hypothetical protein